MKINYNSVWASVISGSVLGICGGIYSLWMNNKFVTTNLYNLVLLQFQEAFNWVAIPIVILGIVLSCLFGYKDIIRHLSRRLVLTISLSAGLTLFVCLIVIRWTGIDIPLFSIEESVVLFRVPFFLLLIIFAYTISIIIHRLTFSICWPSGRFALFFAIFIFLGVNASTIFYRLIFKTSESKQTNVLIISMDTMRADHLGCYGYPRNTSPSLDSFAEEAIRFEKVVVPMSHTLPSHISLFSALDPKSHGVSMNGMKLDSHILTLTEILKNYGLATAAFVGSVILENDTGLSRGFEIYDDELNGQSSRLAEEVRMSAEKWLSQEKDSDFFLFVHMWDTHAPYSPPDPFATMFNSAIPKMNALYDSTRGNHRHLKARYTDFSNQYLSTFVQKEINLYDGEVRYVDQEIGKLFNYMKSIGCWDETLVIVTGDHGESLGERGCWGHELFFEEQILVPLLIKLPESRDVVHTIKESIRLIDIMPTILDILSIRHPERIEGASLIKIIDSNKVNVSRTTYIERRDYPASMRLKDIETYGIGKEYAIRNEQWKLIFKDLEEDELYNLNKDPYEMNNLITIESNTAEVLRKSLFEWLDERPRDKKYVTEKKIDSKKLKQLKSLGYIR